MVSLLLLQTLDDRDGNVTLPHSYVEKFSLVASAWLLRDRTTNVREHVDPEADFVPTVNEVCARFSRLQTGKAVGEDHLGGDYELARLLHPIFAKAALRSCEPWLWRAALFMSCRRKGRTRNFAKHTVTLHWHARRANYSMAFFGSILFLNTGVFAHKLSMVE